MLKKNLWNKKKKICGIVNIVIRDVLGYANICFISVYILLLYFVCNFNHRDILY